MLLQRTVVQVVISFVRNSFMIIKFLYFSKVMEIGVARSYSPDEYIGKGNFVCSGIKITYNLTMEPFHRVAEFKVR